MTGNLTWQEPERQGFLTAHERVWVEEAEAMRAEPGRWLLLKQFPKGEERKAAQLAQNIKRGRLAAFMPTGTFQAVMRSGGVFVRFVGESDS